MNNFHSWLISQINKNTLIGDLAKEVNQDQSAKAVPSNFKSWKAHLEKNNACEEVLLAFKKAWVKFEKLQLLQN